MMSILPEQSVVPAASRPAPAAVPSAWRAWCYLVWLSLQRQARARQMVWIAVGLLTFSAVFIAINTAGGRWDMHRWRWFPPAPNDKNAQVTMQRYGETADNLQVLLLAVPRGPGLSTIEHGFSGAVQTILDRSPFMVFTNGFVLTLFLPFLLPLLSLSFATEALGGDREANNLVWLLTRPISRPSIYLAKFVALLPWSLLLNIGGFALLCSLAGWQGRLALQLFWPAVVWSTFAFAALFFFIGAVFRRPAIVAIVYSFFLETILGNMPGYLKRVSINFYAKCMMYESAEVYGIQPDRPNVFLAVDAMTAVVTLVTVTLVLLAAGTVVFTRIQYQDAV
jgi:hypothetical protein